VTWQPIYRNHWKIYHDGKHGEGNNPVNKDTETPRGGRPIGIKGLGGSEGVGSGFSSTILTIGVFFAAVDFRLW